MLDIICLFFKIENILNRIFFLVEDVESDDDKNKIKNEILPLTSNELPVAKEPIKFSEICSRSSNQ